MFSWLIKLIEKKSGVSLEYLHYISKNSTRLILKYFKLISFSNCRKKLPKEVFHIGAITSSSSEGCSTCLEMAVNLAIQEGINKDMLHAIVRGHKETLSQAQRAVYEFSLNSLKPTGPSAAQRENMINTYGEEAIIELAYVIASVRVYPTVKRTLGYSEACPLA